MKTATGLTLVAIGAIFAFAVTAHPSWINLQIAGWVIMLTGILGIVISRRSYSWLRRRVIVRQPGQQGSGPPAISGTVVDDEPAPGGIRPPAADGPPPGAGPPQETIEEYYEE